MATEPEYVEYISQDGDRWDTIAHAHYGNPAEFVRVMTANPHILINTHLPGGLRVLVPVLADASAAAADDLPPWKREA